MAINWTTVFVAAMGSIGTAVVIIVGAAVAWGRVSQQVKDLVARQDSANGKLASQAEKDGTLDAKIGVIENRCIERQQWYSKNDRDHTEIFARIHSLEIGQAALPGKIADKMDARVKQWRKDFRQDMQRDIRAIFYDLQRGGGRRDVDSAGGTRFEQEQDK
jgi:hypothetical protein